MYEDFVNAIKNSNTIMIISHINPDGDTCGSALALFTALTLFGKKPHIFCDSNIKPDLLFLKNADKYNAESLLDRYDLAISSDCAASDRLGIYFDSFRKAKMTINIDHHMTNPKYAKLNYIEGHAAANCEVMFKLLKALDSIKPCIDKDVASLLYSGLVTDSGGFSFSSVTVQTLQTAADLKKYDVNTAAICEHFLSNTTRNVFNLKNRVLSKTKFYENERIGIIFFSQKDFSETNTSSADTEGIINNVRNVETVDIAVAITQMEGNLDYKVSFRTSDKVDATRITDIFGGGGHKNAAGCRIQGFEEDVKDRVLKACTDELYFSNK